MSDGMGRELAYLSSHATNRYFIPNWGNQLYSYGYGRNAVASYNIQNFKKSVALCMSATLVY